jgi:hypothetical protein
MVGVGRDAGADEDDFLALRKANAELDREDKVRQKVSRREAKNQAIAHPLDSRQFMSKKVTRETDGVKDLALADFQNAEDVVQSKNELVKPARIAAKSKKVVYF